MGNRPRFGELLLQGVLIVAGLAMIMVSLKIGFGTFKKPGSGLFPFFCGAIISSISMGLMVKGILKGSPFFFKAEEMKKFVRLIIPFILWMILIRFFGYVVMTFVCTFSLSKILGLKGWLSPLGLSLGTTGLCYILFDYLLFLDLPRGFLG